MIGYVGMHRSYYSDVVYTLAHMRENITHLYSTLPILFKLEWGTHAGTGFALGGEIAVGKGFAMIFRKHGFWVECVDMRWAAIHKQENDSLGFARQRRKFGRERIYG